MNGGTCKDTDPLALKYSNMGKRKLFPAKVNLSSWYCYCINPYPFSLDTTEFADLSDDEIRGLQRVGPASTHDGTQYLLCFAR